MNTHLLHCNHWNVVIYLNPYLFSLQRPPLRQGRSRQLRGVVKFLAPQVQLALTSRLTPTTAVVLALTSLGTSPTTTELVQLPGHVSSSRHSLTPTMLMFTPTYDSIWKHPCFEPLYSYLHWVTGFNSRFFLMVEKNFHCKGIIKRTFIYSMI